MTFHDPQITVIAAEAADEEALVRMIAQIPGTRVAGRTGTLTQLNGTAVALSRTPGIIVAQVGRDGGDIEAVERMARAESTRARLVMLTDPDMALGEVRRLLQAGVADVLPMPVEPADLAAAIQRLTRPPQLPAIRTERRSGRILTVARARGGIGATTVAVNLADALAATQGGFFRKSAGASVAIVDLDLQFGAVASFLDLEPSDTLYDIAAGHLTPEADAIEAAMATAANGVRVLSAPGRLAPLDALRPEQVGAILDMLRERFDYVIVDLPHSLVDWVQAVIDRTDRMFLVTDSAVPSIRQAKRLVDFFAEETPSLAVEVVVNGEAKPLVRGRHHVQAVKLLERPFRVWLPADPKTTREALDRGVPLSVAARRSPLTKAIQRLAAATRLDLAGPAGSPSATPKR